MEELAVFVPLTNNDLYNITAVHRQMLPWVTRLPMHPRGCCHLTGISIRHHTFQNNRITGPTRRTHTLIISTNHGHFTALAIPRSLMDHWVVHTNTHPGRDHHFLQVPQ